MSRYSSFYPPYVPVAERRRKAEAAAKKLCKNGRVMSPVRIEGRGIAQTFWGKSWCENLESYSDYANRLPRGRTYARNGSVIDLQIKNGEITALVQGSGLYKITIEITPLAPQRWSALAQECAGKITNLLDLLQGRLSKEILADMTTKGTGLFPSPKEITLECSCPDSAGMCKHIAATLYGVGHRLDSKPDLFFTLRRVDMQDLITAASANSTMPLTPISDGNVIEDGNLAEIFGVDIETSNSGSIAADSSAAKPLSRQRLPKAKAAPKAAPGGSRKKSVGKQKGKPAPKPLAKNSKKPKRKPTKRL